MIEALDRQVRLVLSDDMHERERHRIILSAVSERPVATVQDIVDWTGASEATVRRDIATLHLEGKLRRVRGGAEALHPPQSGGLVGRPYSVNSGVNVAAKRAIADAAVALCEDGDAIIINGGTTTFQMVHGLAERRMTIMTNSWPIAETLLKTSHNTVTLPGGRVYRDQQIILSPFEEDATRSFAAKRMFMGAQGIGRLGVMEADPLILRAEQKLIRQAEALVLLATSDKLAKRSSLICCALDAVDTLITDAALRDEDRAMLEEAAVTIVVAKAADQDAGESRSATAA